MAGVVRVLAMLIAIGADVGALIAIGADVGAPIGIGADSAFERLNDSISISGTGSINGEGDEARSSRLLVLRRPKGITGEPAQMGGQLLSFTGRIVGLNHSITVRQRSKYSREKSTGIFGSL